MMSFELFISLDCDQFESPLWAGILPVRLGEPVGGSLSADEYKFALTTPLPIIVRPFTIYLFLPYLHTIKASNNLGEIS